MTHQNQANPSAAPTQIRVTIETLDHKGRVQRRARLAHDFPAWAQERAIERCLDVTSDTAAALLTRALPVLQVDRGVEVIAVDPLDYNGMTCEKLTAQDKVVRICTSPFFVEFSQRAKELGIKSLNVDDTTPAEYLDLIAETFTTWKALVRASDSASRSGER